MKMAAENTGKLKVWKRIARLFREVRGELKKVIWPTRQQLVNSTVSVLIACLLIGIIIWIADALLRFVVINTLMK
jgi:preprotein translocase subunit SecE